MLKMRGCGGSDMLQRPGLSLMTMSDLEQNIFTSQCLSFPTLFWYKDNGWLHRMTHHWDIPDLLHITCYKLPELLYMPSTDP